MPSTYTQSGVELIGNGEQSGTWGTTTNTNLQILDRMISQAGTITLSGTTHTLTISDGVLSDGQYGVLVFGGSPSGANTVTINPNDAQRTYIVKNDSGESVVLTQGSGGNVTVADGRGAIVYCDGAGSGAEVVDLTAAFISTLASLGVTASAAELNQLDGNAFTGDLTIPDKIIHAGDTNTSIRFPAADTVSVETAGSERVRVDSSGNVGIGTSSPGSDLDVFGGIRSTSSGGYSQITTTSIGDSVFNNNGNNWLTVKDGAPADSLRVDSSGNVGIGTSSPNSPLHVESGAGGGGDVWAGRLATFTSFTPGLFFKDMSSGAQNFLVTADSSAFAIRSTPNTDGTSLSKIFTLLSSGNLGVGINNPSEKLDVDGTVKATGLNLGGTAVTATAAELNILDGVTASTAELNILDGVTASTAELNKLDGVAGDVVGTTDTQTLTNKTFGDATAVTTETDNWTGAVTLDPADGLVQEITLTGNVTGMTDSLADGESVILHIDDGTAYTITWPTITWVSDDGVAPTLQTTVDTIVTVWKVGSTLYGFASNGA